MPKGVKLPVMCPERRQRAAQPHMAPVTLEADGGLAMPERLLTKAFIQARIQIQTMTEAKRGLEPAAQVFHARKRDVAALNRAQLGRTLKVAVNAQIQKTADLYFGILRPDGRKRHGAQQQRGKARGESHE